MWFTLTQHFSCQMTPPGEAGFKFNLETRFRSANSSLQILRPRRPIFAQDSYFGRYGSPAPRRVPSSVSLARGWPTDCRTIPPDRWPTFENFAQLAYAEVCAKLLRSAQRLFLSLPYTHHLPEALRPVSLASPSFYHTRKNCCQFDPSLNGH